MSAASLLLCDVCADDLAEPAGILESEVSSVSSMCACLVRE